MKYGDLFVFKQRASFFSCRPGPITFMHVKQGDACVVIRMHQFDADCVLVFTKDNVAYVNLRYIEKIVDYDEVR